MTKIFGDGGFLFDIGIGAGDGVDGFPSGHVVGSGGIAILELDAQDLGEAMTNLGRCRRGRCHAVVTGRDHFFFFSFSFSSFLFFFFFLFFFLFFSLFSLFSLFSFLLFGMITRRSGGRGEEGEGGKEARGGEEGEG